MITIDIEVEDYLDKVETKYLVQELLKRKDLKKYNLNDDNYIPKFKTSDELLRYLKKLLCLREWHDKDRIIAEIKAL